MLKIKTLTLLLTFSLSGCSTRQVYETSTDAVPPLSNAVNINTASVDDLEKLPDIGPKTAESIVNYRLANGPFRRLEHLMLIRGMSERRFLELRPYIRAD